MPACFPCHPDTQSRNSSLLRGTEHRAPGAARRQPACAQQPPTPAGPRSLLGNVVPRTRTCPEQPGPSLFTSPAEAEAGGAATRDLRSGFELVQSAVPCPATMTSPCRDGGESMSRPGRASQTLTRVRAARVGCSFLLLTARTVARTNEADMVAAPMPWARSRPPQPLSMDTAGALTPQAPAHGALGPTPPPPLDRLCE